MPIPARLPSCASSSTRPTSWGQAELHQSFRLGEAFAPSQRDALAARGIQAFQAYATADLGLIAYESGAREGLVVDEGVLVEIVRPGTGDPLPPGEVGEVVVTSFNPDYPLIRFGTGTCRPSCPVSRPAAAPTWIKAGWDADRTTKVKGMFVHPGQIASVLQRHPEVLRGRLVVDNPGALDRMTLHCEVESGSDALAQALASSMRELTKAARRGEVLRQGSLANDGKVIDDTRKYD